MSKTKKTYYEYLLERYSKQGEDMVIWSVYNGKNIDGTLNQSKVKIKDLDDDKIKECIKKFKNNIITPLKRGRIEIFDDVILKRRNKKLNKICSKLDI